MLIYLSLGIVMGLLSGLIGIGGGLIIVPSLSLLLIHQGLTLSSAMQYAIGTSLACILFTASSAVFHHYRQGNIDFNLLKYVSPGLVLGTIVGLYVGHFASGQFLQKAFGIFTLLMSINMLRPHVESAVARVPAPWVLATIGFTTGAIGATLGLGGGVILVPVFTYYCLPMRHVVGTSSSCGFFVSLVAIINNLFITHESHTLPLPWSTGSIYWPAVLGIASMSVLFAPLGVRLTTVLPGAVIKKIFAVFLIIVGGKMLF